MAARKKRAARKVEPRPEPKPIGETVVQAMKSAARSITVTNDEDPRPAAWRKILLSIANGGMVPRDLRVHMDDRFTGRDPLLQVKTLMFVGFTPEDAVDTILKARIADAKASGAKHTATL